MPTQLHSLDVVEVAHDVGSVAANTSEETDITVPGVRPDDFVMVSKPSLDAGVMVGTARVKSDDTVAVTVINATAGAVDPGSETYKIMVFRPYSGTHDTLVP